MGVSTPIIYSSGNPFFMGKHSLRVLCGIARVTPSLPQRGRHPKGASLLDPRFQSSIFRCPLMVCSTKARVDETPSARGPIADQSMISGRFSTE